VREMLLPLLSVGNVEVRICGGKAPAATKCRKCRSKNLRWKKREVSK